jgi:hypothetical protein
MLFAQSRPKDMVSFRVCKSPARLSRAILTIPDLQSFKRVSPHRLWKLETPGTLLFAWKLMDVAREGVVGQWFARGIDRRGWLPRCLVGGFRQIAMAACLKGGGSSRASIEQVTGWKWPTLTGRSTACGEMSGRWRNQFGGATPIDNSCCQVPGVAKVSETRAEVV